MAFVQSFGVYKLVCTKPPYCNTCRSRKWRANPNNNNRRNAVRRAIYESRKKPLMPCASCGKYGKTQTHHSAWRTCTQCNKPNKSKPASCIEHLIELCATCHSRVHATPKRKLGLSYDWRQRQHEMNNLEHLRGI